MSAPLTTPTYLHRYDTCKSPVYQSLEALERKLAEGKPIPSSEEGFDDILKELTALEKEKNDKAPAVEDLLKTLEEVDGLSDVMETQCFQEERADVGRRWERVKDEVSSKHHLSTYIAMVTITYMCMYRSTASIQVQWLENLSTHDCTELALLLNTVPCMRV